MLTLSNPTKVTSSSSNIELRCLAITLVIIFFFNTPISFIKKEQLKNYQQRLELETKIISERIVLINNLLNYAANQRQIPNKLITLDSITGNFSFINAIEYKHSDFIDPKCGLALPSTLKTNTLFDPNSDEFQIYKPICQHSKISLRLYININLQQLCSFIDANYLLLNSEGTIFSSSFSEISPGNKLRDIHPKIWNEISVSEKQNSFFSVEDSTVLVYKIPFFANQSVYIIQIIDDSDLIPSYFYIVIFLFSTTIGISYYLYHLRKEKQALSKIKNRISTDGNYYLCIFDIDHFKKVNDKYGHDVGDQVIRRVAGIIKSKLRFSDYSFRFGGEEFLVIIKALSQEEAIALVDKIRLDVEQLAQKPSVSISGGLCCINKPIDIVIKCADAQLYQAKESGRNLIIY